MKYNFDAKINRQGTNSLKWEFTHSQSILHPWEQTEQCFEENPILPMWVADMDFACPRPVIEALHERVEQGVFGYTVPSESYYDAVVQWMKRRHQWDIRPEWICTTPGVVPAIYMLVRTFVAPGEKVLIQPPVYHPFFGAIKYNKAELVTNPLVYDNKSYRMNFKDLEEKAKDPKVKMAILCSPHNPVGRVWSEEELRRFGEICLNNNVLVVSDEIHGDLIYPGHQFIPFTSIDDDFAKNTIVCTAPSKTFNLAGLQVSNLIIANEQIYMPFDLTLRSNGLHFLNTFGVTALEAAYNAGEEWLNQVIKYIEGNFLYLEKYISQHIPLIDVIKPEGTYLVWLDCRELEMNQWELKELMLENAKIYTDNGFIFGAEGEGFERLNIACPRSILVEALKRMKAAIDQLK